MVLSNRRARLIVYWLIVFWIAQGYYTTLLMATVKTLLVAAITLMFIILMIKHDAKHKK